MEPLKAGTDFRLDRCSVQFPRPTWARYIRLNTEFKSGYDGWAWVDVLMLSERGKATDKRAIFLPLDRLKRSTT